LSLTPEIVIAFVSAALSGTALVVGFLVRWVLGTLVKRLDAAEAALALTRERLHANDVETVRLQGRLALVEASHGELDRDIRDLKNTVAAGFRDLGARLDAIAGGRAYPTPRSDPRMESQKPR
jgi:hypothetical protein